MFFYLNSFFRLRLKRLQQSLKVLLIPRKFSFLSYSYGILFILFGCTGQHVSFKTFDPEQWMEEAIVCKNYRNSVIEAMEAEFSLFIGMDEANVMKYLGKPDETELYTRGQKFFSYYIICKKDDPSDKKLRLRFSALNQVNEVLLLD